MTAGAASLRAGRSARAHFLPAAAPRVSVVVVAWRAAPLALDCLAALARSAPHTPYEVLIVANEPTPALSRVLAEQVAGARVLSSEANLGFGGAVNLAARHARGEYLGLVNDDALVEPGWLDALVEAAGRRRAVAVGGLLVFPDGRQQEAGSVLWSDGWTSGVGRDLAGDDRRYLYERRVDYCSAANLLVRRSEFLDAGGFDEAYYPAYFEDVDLCLRLAAAGGETWFTPLARAVHHESQSTNATYREFLMATNHRLFVERWASLLATRRARENSPAGVERALRQAAGTATRLLVIDDRTPDPSLGSGLGRMADVLDELAGEHLVTFFPGSEGGARDPERLARRGIELVPTDLVAYRGRLGQALADHLDERPCGYDAVVVSRPHNWERYAATLRARLPGVPLIYDAEAVYSRRLERQLALAPDLVTRLALQAELTQMRALEAEIARNADAIVCISEDEAGLFRPHTTRPVLVNPPQLVGAAQTPPALGARAGVGFVAGWAAGASSPNAEALTWFVREVLGRVLARVPDAHVLVSGASPPRNVERLAGPAVVLCGAVADLSELYARLRVAVVPIRYGAGVKLKAIEALQHGVPVVATTVGAEGIPLDEPEAIVVADDPARFADAVVALLTDDEEWARRRHAIDAQEQHWAAVARPTVWRDLVAGLLTPVRQG